MENSRTNPPDPEELSSQSKYGVTRPLDLRCRIFISHSGKNKDFVRHLYDKLVNLFHDDQVVFFDEKTLPTAEPISMENILAEARGCELGVLILTKEFFMHTPNPMLELETLTTSEVRLLPLFFRISVDEFKKMRRNNVWEKRWKQWLKGDDGRLRAWKHALGFVDRFSGLEYCKLANNDLEFIRIVVEKVKHIIRPANPFSEEGLWGMDRLCKIVNNMYKQCALKRARSASAQVASISAGAGCRKYSGELLDLVAMYGFAGLGKSTLCRCLCNYYYAEFHGKVCWLDLGSVPDSSQALSETYSSGTTFMYWRMRYLLSKLTDCIDDVHSLTSFEIENLVGNWIIKRPIFLAIDNISPDLKSLEEADFYLSRNFAKGSKIFITSRSEKILERVIINGDYAKFSAVIEHIPKLKFEEGRGIFLHKIPRFLQISNMEDEVKECVSACVICLDDDQHHLRDVDNKWYHPLMLKSSAASIRYDRRHNVDLKSKMREFMQSATAMDKSDARKAVFNLFDITYALLSEQAKKVFLDLSLFYKVIQERGDWSFSSYAWIRSVYSHVDSKELKNIVWSLEDLSLIDVKDFSCDDLAIRMHDLMVDFSKYKALEGARDTSRYLVLDNGAQLRKEAFSFVLAKALTTNEWPSISALPSNVRTISVSGCSNPGAEALEPLDFRNFQGVEVLHLGDNPGVQEVLLSRSTVAHLCSFIVKGPLSHSGSSLRCTIDEDWPIPPTANQVTAGGNLAWVELTGNVIISTRKKRRPWWPGAEQSLLQRLGIYRSTAASVLCGLGILQPVLQYLALSSFPAQSIDLTTCTNLKTLRLKDMPGLRDIHGLETLTNLDQLDIEACHQLLLLSIPANLRLSKTIVHDCRSLQRICLLKISHPEADLSACASHGRYLTVRSCPALRNVVGIGQYTGHCWFFDAEGMVETIRELLEPFETGSSKFEANVNSLELEGYPVGQGLAGLRQVTVTEAQHVGLLISALVKVQATGLHSLQLCCKEDGDCGCDRNEPQFGPWISPSVRFFKYHCSQVRHLASRSLLWDSLKFLSLSGCRNVEVWPDFATMTSLSTLDLSFTSLKELPTDAQLLRLEKLDVQGCWQLPAKEFIKAVTCKTLGCSTSAWGTGLLQSLLADLKSHRRDRGSVADAIDSQWPELVALFHKQWQYLRHPYPFLDLRSLYPTTRSEDFTSGRELSYLIRLMYDLWFGVECEAEAGSTCACADSVPTVKEKMKRLLCSEIFMALPFYVWRIGRTRLHAVDEWEEYPWPEGYESYMAFALIGSASIGCFNASLNDDLNDRMVNFVQSFAETQPQHAVEELYDVIPVLTIGLMVSLTPELHLTKESHERLAMRVGDAVCKMARAPSVAAVLLGPEFMHITMDGLKASYTEEVEWSRACESLFRWLNRTQYWSFIDVENSRKASESLFEWLNRITYFKIWGRKPTVATLKSDEASMYNSRVLHKIMLKILPHSVVHFRSILTSVCEG